MLFLYTAALQNTRHCLGEGAANFMTSAFSRTVLLLVVWLIAGCGSESGTVPPPRKISFSNGASLNIVDSGAGRYVVQGENLEGVAGFDITIAYDAAKLTSPAVTQGEFVTGFLMGSNTRIDGVVRVALVGVRGVSGTGDVCRVQFSVPEEAAAAIGFNDVKMIDERGKRLY